jgi:hypothetical protein
LQTLQSSTLQTLQNVGEVVSATVASLDCSLGISERLSL